MTIIGNPTALIKLSKKQIAIRRAMGADIKTLAAETGLSPVQVTMALEDMKFIKRREGSTEKAPKKETKLDAAITKWNLPRETIVGIAEDLGIKTNLTTSRKYIIVDDLLETPIKEEGE